MSSRSYSNRQLRSAARTAHLVLAGLLIMLTVVAPLLGGSTARTVTLAGLAPLLALTGIVMWRPAPLRRLLSRRAGATDRAGTTDHTGATDETI